MSKTPENNQQDVVHSSGNPGHGADAAPREAVVRTPLLPLVGSVIFPKSIYPLQLRGEQSEALVRAALEHGGYVALFLQKELAADPPTEADLYGVGTLAVLEDVVFSDDGDISVNAVGVQRVELLHVEVWEPFVVAQLKLLTDRADEAVTALFSQVGELYRRVIESSPELAAAMVPVLEGTTSAAELAYLVASTVAISPPAKQAILELDAPEERLAQLVPLLSRAVEAQAKGTKGNLAAKEPAGDSTPIERVELQSALQKADLPDEARRVAERELAKLGSLSPISPDYNMVRTYLQWLADLPWAHLNAPEPAIDLVRSREILDRDHYGLAEVKERILEYLAVRKLRQERNGFGGSETGASTEAASSGDPVLCLVGPPGIGKTSLGKSISEALSRPFVRISLGGVSDEADIRGHRRTYLGAMPGKIIQGLSRISSNHPIVMLDELDKIGTGKGDPASALLEVLDPEQQSTFLDHYLDVPFDLSPIFFLATANLLDTVPPALRDRLEVIQLSGYTEDEKVEIALRHLVPRQMEWHALRPSDARWDPDAILSIVRGYTREAGVRQLEREIAAVCRRVATVIATSKTARRSPMRITVSRVGDILGTPRYLSEPQAAAEEAGIALGVVWTPVGGDIIHVEATMMPGHKTLTITGQLGEIMRESAQAALSYVRSQAFALGADPQFFEHNDVHLHVPSGAVPKDGPSAGITLAAALVSRLTNRPVLPQVAMTGELTLTGRVLPVGGIKEKVLAARRAGIRKVILPTQNKRDLEDIAPENLENIEFVFADTMDDVLVHAFGSIAPEEVAVKRQSPRHKAARHNRSEDTGDLPRAAHER